MPSEAMEAGCTCQRCEQTYRLDIMVPDELWEQIKPAGKPEGGGLLCGECIAAALENRIGFGSLTLSRPLNEEEIARMAMETFPKMGHKDVAGLETARRQGFREGSRAIIRHLQTEEGR